MFYTSICQWFTKTKTIRIVITNRAILEISLLLQPVVSVMRVASLFVVLDVVIVVLVVVIDS